MKNNELIDYVFPFFSVVSEKLSEEVRQIVDFILLDDEVKQID